MASMDSFILKALTESANSIASQARLNASWSSNIPGAISVTPAVANPTGYEVTITLNLGDGSSRNVPGEAPEGGAFEFGSGIHTDRTGFPLGKYEIRPREASALAFTDWTPADFAAALSSQKLIDFIEEDGLWVFAKVDHPGVRARPFMRPAIMSKLPEVNKKLNTAIRAYLMSDQLLEEIK